MLEVLATSVKFREAAPMRRDARGRGLYSSGMGRFDDRASTPRRGPADIFKWKVMDALAGKNRKDPGGFVTPRRAPDPALVHGDAAQITWIGHASFFLTLGGKRIVIDPVWSPRIGPVARLAPPGLTLADMPPVDVVLVSHNHRDHLDEASIEQLGARPTYVVPVGNGELIRKLGGEKIIELDWWETTSVGTIDVTVVPARHWSMRFPWDRNDALWGGFVIRARDGSAYHSGDTGFFDGFKEIGERCGPIDTAMLPIGAYEPRWFMKPQHMGPEDAVEAARMLGAKRLVAMHWGTFKLTDEPVAEPPERVKQAFGGAADEGRELWVLDIGESRRLEALAR